MNLLGVKCLKDDPKYQALVENINKKYSSLNLLRSVINLFTFSLLVPQTLISKHSLIKHFELSLTKAT